jgi:hypothetical protein
MGDEEQGQLAAARWGITSTLAAWSVGSLLVALDEDAQAIALGEMDLAEDTVLTMVVGGVVCMALAVLLWIDSSPRRVAARRQQAQRRLARERARAEPIA